MTLRPIGISGVATSGKDTLFKLLENRLGKVKRIALADALKADLDGFLTDRCGISAFTQNPEEKSLIRDLLVGYGKIRRKQSKGTYWTQKVQPQVTECLSYGVWPIITDIRYDFYPTDERYWLQTVQNGFLIHVSRTRANGEPVLAPNIDEAENDPLLRERANFRIAWETYEDFQALEIGETEVINNLIYTIKGSG